MSIWDLLKRKKGSDEPEPEELLLGVDQEPKESSAQGKLKLPDEAAPEAEARSINKSVVYGIAGVVAAVVLASLCNNLFASKPKDRRNEVPDLTIARNTNNPAANLPDSYKAMAKYELARKKQEQTVQKKEEPEPVKSVRSQSIQVEDRPVSRNYVQDNRERDLDKVRRSNISFELKGLDTEQDKEKSETGLKRQANVIANTYELSAGTIIPATLLTGCTSDVPGADVVAQVRQSVYDSLSGRHLLIPQGAKLLGVSGSMGNRGNKRLTVVFKRILFPDGTSMELPNQQALDGPGTPGLRDRYDQHSSTLMRSAFLAAAFSAAAQSATGGSGGKEYRSSGEEAVSGAVASILNTAQSIVNRDANLNPTLVIRPGTQFNVFLNRDLRLDEFRSH